MKTFLDSIFQALTGRTLFISSFGHIALVPDYAKTGDLIRVMFGGAALFVLRRLGGDCVLIGECYCHGLMDGEAIKDLKVGKLKAQDFTLV